MVLHVDQPRRNASGAHRGAMHTVTAAEYRRVETVVIRVGLAVNEVGARHLQRVIPFWYGAVPHSYTCFWIRAE